MAWKIEVNKETCIGCGSCEAICPDAFEIKNGKSAVKKAKVAKLTCEKEAKEICPVDAIKVTEVK